MAPTEEDFYNGMINAQPKPVSQPVSLRPTIKSAVESIISTRDGTHGKYETTAKFYSDLKDVMYNGTKVAKKLTPGQEHALDMITVKIARICSGDPSFEEHWRDIEGYAKLVADGLKDRSVLKDIPLEDR